MKTYLRPAVSLFILLSVILGGLYPALVTLVGQSVFPAQANGSLIERDGKPVGSELIGQDQPAQKGDIPVDLLTSSGSGLDPHISPAAAQYQVERVAQARGLPLDKVRALVAAQTETPQLGFLGDPRVNVLKLNLALDALVK